MCIHVRINYKLKKGVHKVHNGDYMKLHYSNSSTHEHYVREVVSITFHMGVLFVILKNENGEEYSTSYTEDSLNNGMITIF